MLAQLLDRGGRGQQFLGLTPGAGTTCVTPGLPRVMVPVLSSTTVVTRPGNLERVRFLDQNAQLSPAAAGHKNRRGRRQSQGARTCHDQHRDRGRQALEPIARGQPPNQQRRGCNHQHHRHEPATTLIGQPLNFGFRFLRSRTNSITWASAVCPAGFRSRGQSTSPGR